MQHHIHTQNCDPGYSTFNRSRSTLETVRTVGGVRSVLVGHSRVMPEREHRPPRVGGVGSERVVGNWARGLGLVLLRSRPSSPTSDEHCRAVGPTRAPQRCNIISFAV